MGKGLISSESFGFKQLLFLSLKVPEPNESQDEKVQEMEKDTS